MAMTGVEVGGGKDVQKDTDVCIVGRKGTIVSYVKRSVLGIGKEG